MPISYAQALELILQASPAAIPERCAVSQSLGRVLAAPVFSPQALPSFNNAALDGYALPAGDFPAAAEFVVEGRQAAGEQGAEASRDTAWEVTTGACMPGGLSTVVPVEQVEVVSRDPAGEPARIRLLAPVRHAQHVRRIGEDVGAGQAVLDATTWLRAPQLMLLSALGVVAPTVARRPKVAVISTGHELVDDPTQPLREAQIRNANRPYLCARVNGAGAELVGADTVDDNVENWRVALRRALDGGAEVIVTTGGVSMGRHDFVPAALAEQGAQILFHKVAIRPGKPVLFARLPNGTLYFGLPGNPVACAVGFRFFVETALRAMLGMPAETPCWLPLSSATRNHRPAFRHYLKGRVALDGGGRCVVSALPGQESFRILPLSQANGWLVLPEGQDAFQAGDPAQVYSLGHEQPLIGTDA
ncbi:MULTISPECIES: molybdopterin molybdotransferase MoeA [unclassified Pseudoxanthomonas]|uniref:molybdopterin molybdotransferase MoeA n=1 Tax=unclassified Pseudoxanthomonas TaxID=2645906 RepID=UPI003078A0E9